MTAARGVPMSCLPSRMAVLFAQIAAEYSGASNHFMPDSAGEALMGVRVRKAQTSFPLFNV